MGTTMAMPTSKHKTMIRTDDDSDVRGRGAKEVILRGGREDDENTVKDVLAIGLDVLLDIVACVAKTAVVVADNDVIGALVVVVGALVVVAFISAVVAVVDTVVDRIVNPLKQQFCGHDVCMFVKTHTFTI